ncbi:MAG: hypothetical protein MSH10_04675 [Pygmaiobacter massiliensis]|nr:hypothetical protein [Pygmaiobacter massiliensis]
MKNGTTEGKQKLEQALQELPQAEQQALYWMVQHWDLVRKGCKGSRLSDEKIEQYKKAAKEKGDAIVFALLCAVQAVRTEK